MKNVTFVYTDLSDDKQSFNLQVEMQLIHDTEMELDYYLGVVQVVYSIAPNSPLWVWQRGYVEICEKVEGI
jgi:hypothetical protein